MSKNKGIIGDTVDLSDEFQNSKNYFFGIGINSYEHFLPLSNARKDIEDIANVLIEKYCFEEQNIHLIKDKNANRENIIEELDSLRRKIKDEDRLLIYYSGHGFIDEDRGFWIPVNAERNKTSSYVSNAEVRDIIKSIKARHILLISDSCFSASLLVRDATRDIGGAFVDWERNPSRWVFISGKGVVSDGKIGENSPFAACILKQLRYNQENTLNIVRLADSVTQEVRFNYEQQAELSPLFQVGHSGGQFVFKKRDNEDDDWQKALDISNLNSFKKFIRDYPKSVHFQEAAHKIEQISNEILKRERLEAEEQKRLDEEIKEKELWETSEKYDKPLDYLEQYPNGTYAVQALTLKTKIDGENSLEKKEDDNKAFITIISFLITAISTTMHLSKFDTKMGFGTTVFLMFLSISATILAISSFLDNIFKFILKHINITISIKNGLEYSYLILALLNGFYPWPALNVWYEKGDIKPQLTYSEIKNDNNVLEFESKHYLIDTVRYSKPIAYIEYYIKNKELPQEVILDKVKYAEFKTEFRKKWNSEYNQLSQLAEILTYNSSVNVIIKAYVNTDSDNAKIALNNIKIILVDLGVNSDRLSLEIINNTKKIPINDIQISIFLKK